MAVMASFGHLLKSYDVDDLLDKVASADPPAYLRRCFAEACSAASLSPDRIQEIAVCAMILDAIIDDRDYELFEHEMIADWRVHYAGACSHLRATALEALRRALDRDRPQDEDAARELQELAARLGEGHAATS
jgi:hypothetical protein